MALLAVVVVAAAALRLRVIDVPLERDEGEYAYLGQLMLQGSAPFEHAWNMKLPGTAAAYALAMAAFGETTRGIRLGLIGVTSATTVLLYLLGRRLFGRAEGVAAAAAFATLSLSTETLGIFGHATHFVVLPASAALLVLLSALDSGRLRTFFASGLLFGVAILMKQPGGAFLAAGVSWIAWSRLRREGRRPGRAAVEAAVVVASAAVPLLVTVAIIARAGALDRFRSWVLGYAVDYGTSVPAWVAAGYFTDAASRIVAQGPLLWALAGAGLALLLAAARGLGDRALVVALPAFSLAGVSAGLYFREHYFILALPGVSLLVAGALWVARRSGGARSRILAPAVASAVVAGCAHAVYAQGDVFFRMTPVEVSRTIYGLNPFPESVEIARYLEANTRPGDGIAVLGSEPQIYFHAHRRAATGYLYMYPLMERHPLAEAMQEEVIREIERARPAFLVWVRVRTSWLQSAGSSTRLFGWAANYVPRHYDLAGVVAILGPDRTEFRWTAEEIRRGPAAEQDVLVFRRRTID